jgi:FKBP-type peptidyl-prolyl cis-trans isomerase
VACGGGAGSTSSTRSDSTSTGSTAAQKAKEGQGSKGSGPTTEASGAATAPKVRVPPGPPPTKLIVKDLKKGSGPPLESGQRIRINYIGVTYKTGKPFEVKWGKTGPFTFNYGSGELIEGWEIGLKGMKVGGRRELIVPSKLAYDSGALVYVIELIANE